jgi:hypothetical protein
MRFFRYAIGLLDPNKDTIHIYEASRIMTVCVCVCVCVCDVIRYEKQQNNTASVTMKICSRCKCT